MSDAILNITDGTTTISLINPSSGFHLVNWVPAITDYKGGGVFQDPPLADWRQLRVGKWATAVENFGLTINGQNPDNAAYNLQELRRLLEKANAYWTTDWQNTPVYIEARAKCETNTRYCLVVKGRLANDQNYYRQPFTGIHTTMRDLPLIIERRAWLENVPFSGNAVAISAVETYDGVNFGNVDSSEVRTPTTANEVYVSNKRNEANLTDVYNFDASGPSFSGNLIGAALPFTLFPSPAAVGDIVYFGIDTSVSDSGPFASLVFDIGTAAAAGTSFTLTWEYWNGAWTSAFSATFQDNTNSFQNTGVNSVHWKQPVDWATTSINGVTAYWVRVRLSALTGAFTNPTQQNRNIYSIVWPYVEIQSSVIKGDIFAKLRKLLYGQSNENFSNLLVGLRSNNRGENFTPFINIANEQNPSGIAVALDAITTAFATNTESPSGIVARLTPPGAVLTPSLYVTFNTTIGPEYRGTYRVFLRYVANISSTIYSTYLIFTAGTSAPSIFGGSADTFTFHQTEAINTTTNSTADVCTIDFGQITIPENVNSFSIAVVATPNNTTNAIDWVDIALIPVDESSVEYADPLTVASTGTPRLWSDPQYYLDVDDLDDKNSNATLIAVSGGQNASIWRRVGNKQVLQEGVKQRLYFFFYGGAIADQSAISASLSVQLQATGQYLSLRGER